MDTSTEPTDFGDPERVASGNDGLSTREFLQDLGWAPKVARVESAPGAGEVISAPASRQPFDYEAALAISSPTMGVGRDITRQHSAKRHAGPSQKSHDFGAARRPQLYPKSGHRSDTYAPQNRGRGRGAHTWM